MVRLKKFSLKNLFKFIQCIEKHVRRRGMVGRVPTFQPGGQGSRPGGIRNFNFYPGTGCVSFVCVSCPTLSLAVLSHSADHRFQDGPLL